MLSSKVWVSAYIRRCSLEGLACVVSQKGAPEAGAIFIHVDLLDGTGRLFAPALGPQFSDTGLRNWDMPLGTEPVEEQKINDYLARQKRFDPDIWVVDVEDRTGDGLIT